MKAGGAAEAGDYPSSSQLASDAAFAACLAYARAVDEVLSVEAASASVAPLTSALLSASNDQTCPLPAPAADAALPLQSAALCAAWCDLGRALYLQALAVRRAGGGSGLGLWLSAENLLQTEADATAAASGGSLHAAVQRYAVASCRAATRAHSQAVRHNPSSARAWNGLGCCATALGRPGIAQHALVRSAALQGGGIALVNLGALYTAGGRLKAAAEVFAQVG